MRGGIVKKRELLQERTDLSPWKQASICQAGKIQMNTEVKNKKTGSAFKTPSRTKSPIRINKHYNAQGSTKPLQRTYCIESMDSDTDCVVANKKYLKSFN